METARVHSASGETFMVFAHHAHVFPAEIRPEGTIGKLLECMDRFGLDRAVCFPPFPYHMAGGGWGNPNNWLAEALKSHRDRLVPFGTVDPESRDAPLEVLNLKQRGVRGIKLHPPAQDFAVDSQLAQPFYEAAGEAGMVLTFHTGVHDARISRTRPALIDDLLFSYPGITVTLEHVGGRAFRNEAVGVIQNHMVREGPHAPGRAYGGLTSVLAVPPGHPWRMTGEEVMELVADVGAERLLFGLDFPYAPPEYLGRAVREVRSLPLSQEQKDQILGGTLARLIG